MYFGLLHWIQFQTAQNRRISSAQSDRHRNSATLRTPKKLFGKCVGIRLA